MGSDTAAARVLRCVGGFYRVALSDGSVQEGRLAGRLKPRGARAEFGPVLPGDLVQVEQVGDLWVLNAILPRSTELVRPSIANVELCVIVQSVTHPVPNLELLDRILIQTRRNGLTSVICLSKADLLSDRAPIDTLLRPYRQAGYQCLVTSAITGEGIGELGHLLRGRISTLAGPSGVGKSRVLNAVCPEYALETGAVSAKSERGRHTTRQVELLPVSGGGWVADTPGFSTLEFGDVGVRELPTYYPDYVVLAGHCHFGSCTHRMEPRCAVVEAVEAGELDSARYQRYLRFAREVEENEARRY